MREPRWKCKQYGDQYCKDEGCAPKEILFIETTVGDKDFLGFTREESEESAAVIASARRKLQIKKVK